MKAILSDSTVTELRAFGCEIKQPLSGYDGIVCRIIMPTRRVSTADQKEILALIIKSLNGQMDDSNH